MNVFNKDGDGDMLLYRLYLKGICISTGFASDSVNTQLSHLSQAIKVPIEYAHGTIRITLGAENTEVGALTIAEAVVKRLRSKLKFTGQT